MSGRFRGHAEARIDDKGRLKIPSNFKKSLEATYGRALFITALTNEYLQVYPLPVWEEIEARVAKLGLVDPTRRRFLTRVNRYGLDVEMDGQGRITLRPIQRELVSIKEHVVVIGCIDHIQIWPVDGLIESAVPEPLSADDLKAADG